MATVLSQGGRVFDPPSDWWPEPQGSQVNVLKSLVERGDFDLASQIVAVPNACSLELYYKALAFDGAGDTEMACYAAEMAVSVLAEEYYEAEILLNFSLPPPSQVGLVGDEYSEWKSERMTSLLVSLRDARNEMDAQSFLLSKWSNSGWAYWSDGYAVLDDNIDKLEAIQSLARLWYEGGRYAEVERLVTDDILMNLMTYSEGDLCAPSVGLTRESAWACGVYRLAALEQGDGVQGTDNSKPMLVTWKLMYEHAKKYRAEMIELFQQWDWFFAIGVVVLRANDQHAEACLAASHGDRYFGSSWCKEYLAQCD